jgi:Ni,Fe-hydrogenase I cytochrome b subunit
VILLIFSQATKAKTNTIARVSGILIAVLNASFGQRYNARTANTIIIDSTRFIRSIFVASLACFHWSAIISICIFLGNSFFISSNFFITSFTTKTALVPRAFQTPRRTISLSQFLSVIVEYLLNFFVQYLIFAISSR